MHKARITVSVRPQTLKAAEKHVARGRAKSISAWVDSAMEEKARREDLAALLAEMRAAAGPVTEEEEEAWARRVLGLSFWTPARSSLSRLLFSDGNASSTTQTDRPAPIWAHAGSRSRVPAASRAGASEVIRRRDGRIR